jgi:hypothetical protein
MDNIIRDCRFRLDDERPATIGDINKAKQDIYKAIEMLATCVADHDRQLVTLNDHLRMMFR